MDLRFGLIFLLVLGATWDCGASRVASPDSQVSYLEQEGNIDASAEGFSNSKICKFCERFVTRVVTYFAQKRTQTEITGFLQRSCSLFGALEQECINLVDTYVPQFFKGIASIEPDDVCQKVHFCAQSTIISSQIEENSCGLCHQTVSKMLVKLKDPDTQIAIIERLLKTCNSMTNHEKECKRLVFQYGPLLIANSEKFLEKTDICTAIHACAPVVVDMSASSVDTVPLADS